MVFNALENLKNLASQGTSPDFNINTAIFKEASGGSLFGTNQEIESGASTQQLTGLSRLLENVSSASFRIPTIESNQISIGESLKDLSKGLTDNIAIRENQRAETFGLLSGFQEQLNSFNERTSGQLEELGSSLNQGGSSDTASGILDKLGSVIGVSGLTAGIIIGGIIILKVVK